MPLQGAIVAMMMESVSPASSASDDGSRPLAAEQTRRGQVKIDDEELAKQLQLLEACR